MQERGWDVATDALVAEQLLATTLDPVTHRATAVSLHDQCPRTRDADAVLTVVTLGYDSATTHALPGRARGLDVAERVLCRHLERWAPHPGSIVGIGEAAVAYVATTSHEEAQEIRQDLPALRAQIQVLGGAPPLVGAAQGLSKESSEVAARAVERLLLPRGTLPAQDHWSAGEARWTDLWDVTSGRHFARQLRLQATSLDDAAARRAEGVQALTRPPRHADTASAVLGAVEHLAAGSPHGRVVWDATSVLAATGPARAPLAELLTERCPARTWVGVAAWLLNVPEVLAAVRTVRTAGRRVVATGYGSGREPMQALDELPVDAVVLDPHLERGSLHSSEDRVVLEVVRDHARRNALPVLTVTRAAVGLDRHPVPVARPRTPRPDDQLLERTRLVGMTLREAAVLLNATHGQGASAPRWDRYDVATHWVRSTL